MKSIIQEALEYANEENGDEIYKCRSYSGRGMYGSKCLGVVMDSDHLGQMFAHLIEWTDDEVKRLDLAEEVSSLRMDSMGLSMIVYFPRAKYTEPEEDEGEDEEDGEPRPEEVDAYDHIAPYRREGEEDEEDDTHCGADNSGGR